MRIVKDSNDEYHAQKSISASGLKEISKNSVYHHINRLPFESSSMALGTAVHTALLEPDTFYDIYYPLPEIKDARTKEGRLLKKEAEEKLNPKNERINQIQKEILDEVDAQAGIVKE